MSGKRVTHMWYYRDELKFEASFNVRANWWRVWSTQLLPSDLAGEWRVEIVDENGRVLQIHKLNFAPLDGEILASS
jgi:hypothetical protein